MTEAVVLTWTERSRLASYAVDKRLEVELDVRRGARTLRHGGHEYEYVGDKDGRRVFRDMRGWYPRVVEERRG